MKSSKRLSLFFLLLSLSFSFSLVGQCGHEPTGDIVGGGRTISSQTELDNFISRSGEKFTLVNNRLQLVGGGPDPIVDLCNLSALKTINGDLQFEGFGPENSPVVYLPNLVEVKRLKIGDLLGAGNSGLVSVSAPKLERVNGILTINDNPKLQLVNFPELQYVGDPEIANTTALFLQDNPSLKAAILPKAQSISGSINILSGHSALTHIQVSGLLPKTSFSSWIKIKGSFPALIEASFPEVVAISGFVDFDGVNASTAATVAFPELARVGEFVEVNSFASHLSFDSDRLKINGDFRIRNNDKLEQLSTGKARVLGNFLVQDNEAAYAIDAEVAEVNGFVKIASSGNFPVAVALPGLEKVGGAFNLLNAGQKEVAIGKDLEVLGNLWVQAGPDLESLTIDVKTVGHNFIISGNGSLDWKAGLRNVRVPQLSEVKGDFSIVHLPHFQGFQGESDFSQLQNIGSGESKLEIFDNPLLEECCLFSCQVNLNGGLINRGDPNIRIFGNAGSCKSFGALLSACPQNPSTTFTQSTVRRWRRNYLAYTADNTRGVSAFDWQVFYDDRLVYTGTRSSLYLTPRTDEGQTVVCLTVTNECGSTATHCEKYGESVPDPDTGIDFGPTLKPKAHNGANSTAFETAVLNAFPNPFQGQLTVSLAGDKAYDLQLFNVAGVQVRELSVLPEGHAASQGITLLTDDLPAGVYLLRGQSKDGTESVSRKLLKH